jgi:glycosyltransferase involved in cell wall biosynthesis
MNGNILYLSYDGLTDPLGQSQILPYLCGLSVSYSITIVSFEKKERFQEKRQSLDALCSRHKIVWVPMIYHKDPPVLSTLYDVFKLWQISRSLHNKKSFDIVHCRSYITSLVGLWMKRRYNIKFVFDMRGFWADERVDGGLWKLSNPVYKSVYNFFKRKEKQFIEEADVVISLTENAKQEILSWNLNKKIKVIPCCVDLTLFNAANITPAQQNALRSELGIAEHAFVVLYLGSLGTWYMTDEMLTFFSALKKNKPCARFLILTPDKPEIGNYRYKDDTIVRKVSRELVPLYISISQASLIFIKPVFSKKASSATKMAEVLAMGVPIVVNSGWGDVEYLLENGTCGVLLKNFEAGEMNRGVEELIALTSISKKASPKMDMENFSLTSGVDAYRAVYDAIYSKHPDNV